MHCISMSLPAPSGHLTAKPFRQRHGTREGNEGECESVEGVLRMCVCVEVTENMVQGLF